LSPHPDWQLMPESAPWAPLARIEADGAIVSEPLTSMRTVPPPAPPSRKWPLLYLARPPPLPALTGCSITPYATPPAFPPWPVPPVPPCPPPLPPPVPSDGSAPAPVPLSCAKPRAEASSLLLPCMLRLTATTVIEGASIDVLITTAPAYLISYDPEVVFLGTLNVQVPAKSMLSHDRPT
jgi:hypothetical protein